MTDQAPAERTTAARLCHDRSGAACSTCAPRIVGQSFAINLVSTLVKAVVGVLCGSQSLISDAVNSFSDVLSFGINFAGGRSRWLTPFRQSLLVGSITFLAGIWIYADNISILIIGERARPGLLGPFVAGVSLLINLYLYSISACAQRRSPSTATLLCVIQNKSNCHAAVLALIGMVLADFGLTFADPLCAVLIGLFLFTSAFEMFKQAFGEAQAEPSKLGRQKWALFFVLALLSGGIVARSVSHFVSRNDTILIPASGPDLASPVDELFGRAPYLLVVNTEKPSLVPLQNGFRHFEGDVSDPLLKIFHQRGVDLVLAKKVGKEMFGDLRAAGIRIYYVHQQISAAEALARFRNGRYVLATSPNVGRGFGRQKVRWLAPW